MLTYPFIHTNGTSANSLIEAIEEAHKKLTESIKALAECAPHGRDYYVQVDNPIQKARDEHYARLGKLHEVQKELEIIVSKIDEQVRR